MAFQRACDFCSGSFTAQRKSARFCSANCRVKWNRQNHEDSTVRSYFRNSAFLNSAEVRQVASELDEEMDQIFAEMEAAQKARQKRDGKDAVSAAVDASFALTVATALRDALREIKQEGSMTDFRGPVATRNQARRIRDAADTAQGHPNTIYTNDAHTEHKPMRGVHAHPYKDGTAGTHSHTDDNAHLDGWA